MSSRFTKYLDSHHRVSGSSEESDADDGSMMVVATVAVTCV